LVRHIFTARLHEDDIQRRPILNNNEKTIRYL